MEKVVDARHQRLLDIGLDEAEITYLATPVKLMNPQQRLAAQNIWDKRNTLIATENDEFRRLQAEREAMEKAEGELEFDSSDIPMEREVVEIQDARRVG